MIRALLRHVRYRDDHATRPRGATVHTTVIVGRSRYRGGPGTGVTKRVAEGDSAPVDTERSPLVGTIAPSFGPAPLTGNALGPDGHIYQVSRLAWGSCSGPWLARNFVPAQVRGLPPQRSPSALFAAAVVATRVPVALRHGSRPPPAWTGPPLTSTVVVVIDAWPEAIAGGHLFIAGMNTWVLPLRLR
jgi:hypothetical protein